MFQNETAFVPSDTLEFENKVLEKTIEDLLTSYENV